MDRPTYGTDFSLNNVVSVLWYKFYIFLQVQLVSLSSNSLKASICKYSYSVIWIFFGIQLLPIAKGTHHPGTVRFAGILGIADFIIFVIF